MVHAAPDQKIDRIYQASDLGDSAIILSLRSVGNRSRNRSATYARCMQATWNEEVQYCCEPSTLQRDGRTV